MMNDSPRLPAPVSSLCQVLSRRWVGEETTRFACSPRRKREKDEDDDDEKHEKPVTKSYMKASDSSGTVGSFA